VINRRKCPLVVDVRRRKDTPQGISSIREHSHPRALTKAHEASLDKHKDKALLLVLPANGQHSRSLAQKVLKAAGQH